MRRKAPKTKTKIDEHSRYLKVNRAFFEKAPSGWLPGLAKIKGLDTNQDLQLVQPHIKSQLKNTRFAALEVGFGYGRIIDWLRKMAPKKVIIGVDHCHQFHEELSLKFKGNKKIILIDRSIHTIRFTKKIDLAFWMWAGFLELDDKHKKMAFDNIAMALAPSGRMILEFPDDVAGHEQIETQTNERLLISTDFGKLNLFRTPSQKLLLITKNAGFELSEEIPYTTMTGIRRRIWILKTRRKN